MSTNKSLKHLKSKDRFLIANASNYSEKPSGWDSSSYIQQTDQKIGVSRRTVFPSTEITMRNRYNTNLWTP